ncbi:MAG TPA: endo-1,4-beta-xylanase [Bacteroidales bacterium]|nr:endo-1,4-beta-xylanase [Bacteroidales bacterium]
MKALLLLSFSFVIFSASFIFPAKINAQSYATWYNTAQERIDTLRKGDFGIKIIDKNGQPYSGPVSVRMKKHEFPFGIAFDFYEGSVNMGNSYNTSIAVQAKADSEIYQSERYGSFLAYSIPVESGKEYKVTLKFAEIYFSSAGSRLFDVNVESQSFLSNYDVFAEAGGKNIAKDTSINITPTDSYINIELTSKSSNASIKGIEIIEIGTGKTIRINCGGSDLTTQAGNQYKSEQGYFDPDANTVASEDQWEKATMYKYFNFGVSGNSFKWSGIQPQHTAPNYTNFENAVAWTKKVGWELRAHTLLWGGYEYSGDHEMPRWVKDLPTPQAITDTCKMRVIREVTRYKGIIQEYDVMNEPLHAKYIASVVGDSINWNCFKWARSADPDAQLFINDYNVEYNWGDAAKYRDLILKIKQMGGSVTGVGMQAHYWDGFRVNVDELVKNVNIVAEAGLPIRFTEYDYAGDITQPQQTEDFIKVLTVAFSHPSISGMICWGLSDKGAWRENTGLFEANHKPKLAADTLLYYTKTKWATNFDTELTNGNTHAFKAYYGYYTVEATFNNTIKVFTVPCIKANKGSVFILNEVDAVLRGPKLISAIMNGNNAIKLKFDKPLQSNSIRKSDFKFFSNYKIGINNIQIDPNNSNTLIISLSANVTFGDYISVSYFPGNLEAIDGSKAEAFGSEHVTYPKPETPTSIKNSEMVNNLKIFPIPATSNLHIKNEAGGPFLLEVFNIVGIKVYSQLSESNLVEISTGQYKRGIYLVKVTDARNNVKTQRIILE